MVLLLEIFCFIDDFCKLFEEHEKGWCLPNPSRKRQRTCQLKLSEIMTLLVLFHISHYRTFKDFYLCYVCSHLKAEFPGLLSYNRFLELIPHALMPLAMLVQASQGEETGKYYIDSTPLPVCHNLRISRNRVFKGLAKRGKSSTGWFFGFKLHLVFNDRGALIRCLLTPGNVHDIKVVEKMTHNLQGWLFGDMGYLSQNLKNSLLQKGLKLLTRARQNMKQPFFTALEKFYLFKRGSVETAIDQLKNICHIQHTRHRSPTNWIANVIAGLVAYVLKINKPCVNLSKLKAF